MGNFSFLQIYIHDTEPFCIMYLMNRKMIFGERYHQKKKFVSSKIKFSFLFGSFGALLQQLEAEDRDYILEFMDHTKYREEGDWWWRRSEAYELCDHPLRPLLLRSSLMALVTILSSSLGSLTTTKRWESPVTSERQRMLPGPGSVWRAGCCLWWGQSTPCPDNVLAVTLWGLELVNGSN